MPKQRKTASIIHNRIQKDGNVSYGAYMTWVHHALAAKYVKKWSNLSNHHHIPFYIINQLHTAYNLIIQVWRFAANGRRVSSTTTQRRSGLSFHIWNPLVLARKESLVILHTSMDGLRQRSEWLGSKLSYQESCVQVAQFLPKSCQMYQLILCRGIQTTLWISGSRLGWVRDLDLDPFQPSRYAMRWITPYAESKYLKDS